MNSVSIRAAWFLTLGVALFPQCALALSLTPSLVAQGDYELLHWRTQPAVGLPSGQTFSSVANGLVMNAQGEYAFNTRSFGRYGIWTNSTSGVQRLVAAQGLLPNDPNIEINPRYDGLFLTNAGATYFHADTDDGEYSDRGVFRETYAGGIETLLLPGTSYSGLPPGTYLDDIFLHNVSRGGTALIRATVKDSTTNSSIYTLLLKTGSGEPLTEILRGGDAPTGLATGESIANATCCFSAQVNASGTALIPVSIVGPTTTGSNNYALVKSDSTGSEVFVRLGQRFGRSQITNIQEFQWTDQEELYFNVSLNGGSLVSLYKADEVGALSPVVTRTTPIQGVAAGVFADVNTFQVNNVGQAIVRAKLFGTGVNDSNNDALLKVDSSGVELLVREGQVAMGFQSAIYGTTPIGSTFIEFDISDEGHVYYTAIMQDRGLGEINANNNTAYWHVSPDGMTTLLVHNYDDTLPFPSDINRVSLRGVTNRDLNSQASGFADDGAIALATFWGSLIIPGERVPEPTSWLICVTAGAAILGQHARRRRSQSIMASAA